MLGTIIGTIITLVALVVLAHPLVARRRFQDGRSIEQDRLDAERLRIYRNVSELRTELTSGDISEREYELELAELRKSAAMVLKRQADLGVALEQDERLELEVQAERARRDRDLKRGDAG